VEVIRTLRDALTADRLKILERIAAYSRAHEHTRAEAIGSITPDSPDTRALLLNLARDPNPTIRREALRSLRGATLDGHDEQRSAFEALAAADPDRAEEIALLLGDGAEATSYRPSASERDAW